MEDQQELVFGAGSPSVDKTKQRWVPAKKGGDGGSSDEADSVSSAITSEASYMLQSLAAAATSFATDTPSDVSTPCSLLPFSASSSSLSIYHMDASNTSSPSVFLAGNLPDAEKMQVVSAGESESDHADNVKTQKEKIQFLQSGAPVPNDVMNEKGKEKSQEISDPAPNLPLPLIPISRVLKGIPQRPHFFPLRGFSELLSEKIIAALDQGFEDTVDQIHNLTKANGFSWEMVCDLWKAMGILELMGYNVLLIRRRLVEMTEVVVELEEKMLTIVELKSQADYHRMEKNRLLNMILSLKNKVEGEELNKEQLLKKVDILKEELSKYNDLIAILAMKPFGINN
ncbi:hypothetical protein L6164_032893 [Bauhinia variegata]|uniref:Uncharacterized protein n=1 Tax=Bauhinia variegata TaxID=167791 RepID=A0ACB9KQG1_BAUVA|nr:hypothetical protein L6164_032893 [Bauhinia variegata]